MLHMDGRIAASAIETVEHLYLKGPRVFDWPKRLKLAAKDFTTDIPDAAAPRNIDILKPHQGRSRSDLKSGGACIVGAGVFGAEETDITERVTTGAFFGRMTSTLGWFRQGWPEFLDPAYRAANLSGALLEARLVFHRYPRQGQAYDYIPVIIGADTYIRRFVHNLVDPISGDSWVTMEACGCKFDLNKRRLIKMSEADVKALMKDAAPELTP
jgi:acyl-CoA thioester hydrolase